MRDRKTAPSHRCLIPIVSWLVPLAAVAAPLAAAEEGPHKEPVVYVSLSETARQVTIRSDGAFRVGRWGTHLPPTRVPAGESWSFAAESGGIVIADGQGHSRGAFSERIFVFPEAPKGVLSLDGARYRGEIILSPLGSKMRVINALGLEDYLKGVLPAEIGRLKEDGLAALKAQAVAARSYTLYQMVARPLGEFDLWPDVADQVYQGFDGEDPLCDEAVDATRGIVALYKGRIIRANYSSTCGGRAASASAVWPDETSLPYLRAREDRRGGADFCAKAPHYRWEEDWDCGELYDVVRKNLWRGVAELEGKDPGTVTRMKILDRTPSGRVGRLAVWTDSGRYVVRGDKVRWVLRRTGGGPLRSAYLGALKQETRDGRCRLVLRGAGYGHGVGMCQTGAIEMSRQGYDFTEILGHYYRGVTLAKIYNGERAQTPSAQEQRLPGAERGTLIGALRRDAKAVPIFEIGMSGELDSPRSRW